MKINVSIEVPTHLESALIRYASAHKELQNPEGQCASDALLFVLQKVVDGLPIDGSLRENLNREWSLKSMFRERMTKLIATAEGRLTDSEVMHLAVTRVLSTLVSGGSSIGKKQTTQTP